MGAFRYAVIGLALLTATAKAEPPRDYLARYEGKHLGIEIQATRRLDCDESKSNEPFIPCRLYTRADAFLGTVTEESLFDWAGDEIISKSYHYNQDLVVGKRERSVVFDHNTATAQYEDRHGKREIALDQPYLDTLNYQVAIAQAAIRGEERITLPVSRRGKAADWVFELVGNRSLELIGQTIDTIHYRKIEEDEDEGVEIFIAPELGGAIVQLDFRDRGVASSLKITEFNWRD